MPILPKMELTRFQSTRPRGARRQPSSCRPLSQSFNPRARAGRDFARVAQVRYTLAFQSTRPRGARQNRKDRRIRKTPFQSTRPRGARLRPCPEAAKRGRVSIHAPARGATDGFIAGHRRLVVSIHAPARGATHRSTDCHQYRRGFNPRARAGRDVQLFTIRAGAAQFQSTRPRGARLILPKTARLF